MPLLPDPSHLLRVQPADPLLRFRVSGSSRGSAARDGDVVGWTALRGRNHDECWATVLGTDLHRVVALLEELRSVEHIVGMTVRAESFAGLPEKFKGGEPAHWSLFLLDRAQLRERPTAAASELPPDDVRIAGLLRYSKSAHVFPGDAKRPRWAGVIEGGQLVSVAGVVREPSGARHIVSVCTHPDARGRRLAEASIAALIDPGEVFLEMYSSNEQGRRAYERMGFVEVGRYASAVLPTSAVLPASS
jgi:ribosomal protein S18 acetylase RimI-like enzyme